MRPLRNFLLLAIILAIPRLGHAQSSDEKRLSITKDVMADFAHGEVASVRARFSDDLSNTARTSRQTHRATSGPPQVASDRRPKTRPSACTGFYATRNGG